MAESKEPNGTGITAHLLRAVGYWLVSLLCLAAGMQLGDSGGAGIAHIVSARLLNISGFIVFLFLVALHYVSIYIRPSVSSTGEVPKHVTHENFVMNWTELFVAVCFVVTAVVAVVVARFSGAERDLWVGIGIIASAMVFHVVHLQHVAQNASKDYGNLARKLNEFLRLLSIRNQVVTPLVLGAFSVFVIGVISASKSASRGHLYILVATLLLYLVVRFFTRSVRSAWFAISGLCLGIIVVGIWLAGEMLKWEFAQLLSVQLYGLVLASYMGMFEFLGTTINTEPRLRTQMRAYGIDLEEVRTHAEDLKGCEELLAHRHTRLENLIERGGQPVAFYYVAVGLAALFLLFPTTALRHEFGSAYLVAAMVFGVGTLVFWLFIVLKDYVHGKRGSVVLGGFKFLAYLVPIGAIAFARCPSEFNRIALVTTLEFYIVTIASLIGVAGLFREDLRQSLLKRREARTVFSLVALATLALCWVASSAAMIGMHAPLSLDPLKVRYLLFLYFSVGVGVSCMASLMMRK